MFEGDIILLKIDASYFKMTKKILVLRKIMGAAN